MSLHWNKEKKIVYAIECKDLEMAKIKVKLLRQLYEFKGQIREINGKIEKIDCINIIYDVKN